MQSQVFNLESALDKPRLVGELIDRPNTLSGRFIAPEAMRIRDFCPI